MRERGEVRGSGWRNRIFLSEPFPSFMSLVARLEQRGGRGREGYLAGSHVCFDIRNSKIY